MDISRIRIGRTFANNKGHIRKVLDFGDCYLCASTKYQHDRDCLLYKIISGNKRGYGGTYMPYGCLGVMTKRKFAMWAKTEVF